MPGQLAVLQLEISLLMVNGTEPQFHTLDGALKIIDLQI